MTTKKFLNHKKGKRKKDDNKDTYLIYTHHIFLSHKKNKFHILIMQLTISEDCHKCQRNYYQTKNIY